PFLHFMKKASPFFTLLFALFFCSCSDDDQPSVNLQLTKITLTQTPPYFYNRVFLFGYNQSGALTSYKEHNLEEEEWLAETIHSYTSSGWLISMDISYPHNGEVSKYTLIYRGQGNKLSDATIVPPPSHFQDSMYYSFRYDSNGRINQVYIATEPGKPRTAFILEYDGA